MKRAESSGEWCRSDERRLPARPYALRLALSDGNGDPLAARAARLAFEDEALAGIAIEEGGGALGVEPHATLEDGVVELQRAIGFRSPGVEERGEKAFHIKAITAHQDASYVWLSMLHAP